FALLLNNDVALHPGCVAALCAAAAGHPGAGMLGPLVLRETDPPRVESCGHAFDPRTARHRELWRDAGAEGVRVAPTAGGSLSGSPLLLRREAFDRTGGLDERLFLYFEDLEWCLRARSRGFEVLAVPQARVSHLGSASIGPASPRTTYYSVRNHMTVARRQAP